MPKKLRVILPGAALSSSFSRPPAPSRKAATAKVNRARLPMARMAITRIATTTKRVISHGPTKPNRSFAPTAKIARRSIPAMVSFGASEWPSQMVARRANGLLLRISQAAATSRIRCS